MRAHLLHECWEEILAKSGKSNRRASVGLLRGLLSAPTVARRWIRRIVLLALILLISPLFLVPAYNFIAPPASTLMLWRLAEGYELNRHWLNLESISPNLVTVVLSSEDARFCLHKGVDWQAVEVVIDDLIDGGQPRGASTITMQLVKNLFLWPSRSYVRKGIEMPLALYTDLVMSKRRIVELYLNIVEWGPGIYGAEAAARRYFGKTAARLSMKEASLLATALPNPVRRSPRNPTSGHRRLAETVEARARGTSGLFSCINQD